MIQSQRGTASVLFVGARTNSATQTANLDTRGADYAVISIALAAEINTNAIGPTISVLTDDTTVVTNFATITADRSAEDITAAKVVQYHVDLKGQQRYLRLSVTTETTTNDNVTVGATGTLYRQADAPGAATNIADVAVIV